MAAPHVVDDEPAPSRARAIFATIAVIVTVVIVWAVIEYRGQPPAPPYPPPHYSPAKPSRGRE